jgi:Domain of unknown function (DUF4349)/Putative zinc-finger
MNTTVHLVHPEEVMGLLDGELSPERAEFVATHFENCPECRQIADSLRSSSRSLSEWGAPTAASSPHFESRLSEIASATSRNTSRSGSVLLATFFRKHWLLSTGASTLAAAIALSLATSRSAKLSIPSQRTVSQMSERILSHDGQPISEGQARVFGGANLAKSPSNYDGSLIERSKNGPAPLAQGSLGAAIGRVGADSHGAYRRWLEKKGPSLGKLELEQGAVGPADRFSSSEPTQAPMIARTLSLSIVVKDFDKSRAFLDSALARHHGYAASLTANTEQASARSLQASLRIPANELSAALAELKSLGQVENETQGGEEVTQQHADLVARLKNSRDTERRLQAILLQRTGKISDVLAVEEQIARVRGEIEQMEAEQKSLEHRVDFAAIDLRLAEEYKAQLTAPSPSLSIRLHNALVRGYRDTFETAVGIVLFLLEFGPTILLWLVLVSPIVLFLRRRWLRVQTLAS